ncbi:MAG TPA: helix-turn-helix domain-containing protein [Kofleriaceae bacterium]|nr:helix-turn-helix domain-containing protein [Kofleriaceae bacterium]
MTTTRLERGARPASSIRGDRPVSSRSTPGAGAPRPERAGRGLRADAAANRARVLLAAEAAFGERGLAVSLDEIARRAGVGPGTVHRHFPTKAALIDATLASGVDSLASEAAGLRRAPDPTEAFCAFLVTMVERGAASHALASRLAGGAGDIDAAVAEPLRALRSAMAALLRRAQRAGGIRRDLTPRDLDAIVAGAHAILVHPRGSRRLVELVCDAMRPTGAPPRRGARGRPRRS